MKFTGSCKKKDLIDPEMLLHRKLLQALCYSVSFIQTI